MFLFVLFYFKRFINSQQFSPPKEKNTHCPSFLPPAPEMKSIFHSLQAFCLTLTLQFSIQWMMVFLSRAIVILDSIYSVIRIVN